MPHHTRCVGTLVREHARTPVRGPHHDPLPVVGPVRTLPRPRQEGKGRAPVLVFVCIVARLLMSFSCTLLRRAPNDDATNGGEAARRAKGDENDGRNLYIGGLNSKVTEVQLRELFTTKGEVCCGGRPLSAPFISMLSPVSPVPECHARAFGDSQHGSSCGGDRAGIRELTLPFPYLRRWRAVRL